MLPNRGRERSNVPRERASGAGARGGGALPRSSGLSTLIGWGVSG